MRNTGVWATLAEIMAAAELYGVPLYLSCLVEELHMSTKRVYYSLLAIQGLLAQPILGDMLRAC